MAESTLMEKTCGETSTCEATAAQRWLRPRVDIIERPDELLVRADMPGVRGDAIDVRFENGLLTIHGRVEPRPMDGAKCLRQEYEVGDFHREFAVSELIDATQISASHQDGVLELRLPKSEAVKPRKISVQVAKA